MSQHPPRTWYEFLQVSPGADEAIIRAAYKCLAQRWHPDRHQANPDLAEKKMAQLNQAYRILSTPILRASYDSQLVKCGLMHIVHASKNTRNTQTQSSLSEYYQPGEIISVRA